MKRQNLYTIFFILIGLFSRSILFAQKDEIKLTNPFSVSCDLMSRYVWRGTDFGASPSIQPSFEYNKYGVSVGAWGAYTMNLSGGQEADLYLGYTFNDIVSVTLNDYFFPNEVVEYKYFNYKNTTTGHIFEISISFNGTEKLPLKVLLATNVWGADAKRLESDGVSVSGNQFSTYAEIGYIFKEVNIFMGANFTNPDEARGELGFYGNTYGIVNLGISTTKNIQLTEKFSLPLTISLITNPQAEKIYLVAGISF